VEFQAKLQITNYSNFKLNQITNYMPYFYARPKCQLLITSLAQLIQYNSPSHLKIRIKSQIKWQCYFHSKSSFIGLEKQKLLHCFIDMTCYHSSKNYTGARQELRKAKRHYATQRVSLPVDNCSKLPHPLIVV